LIKLAIDTGGRHGEPRMDPLKSAPLDDLIAHPVRSKIDENDPEETLLPSSPTTPDSIPLSSIILSII
jgi:hypothetical protein